jgi:exosome complex exonuclease DIS3/RRP44
MALSASSSTARVSFHKLTRRGVRTVTREHYLRDDIACGLAACGLCTDGSGGAAPPLLAPPSSSHRVLVFDTNVILHQLDVLEAAGDAITDAVITETVIEETRHRSSLAHARLLGLLRVPERRFTVFANTHHRGTWSARLANESANDYNDRLVRDAAAWLGAHFASAAPGLRVLLVTNDTLSRATAKAQGLDAVTMRELVERVSAAKPALLEYLSTAPDEAGAGSGGGSTGSRAGSGVGLTLSAGPAAAGAAVRAAGRAALVGVGGASGPYRDHLSPAALEDGLRTGALLQGVVRVNRDCWFEARVLVHGLVTARGEQSSAVGGDRASTGDAVSVLLQGRASLNRATDGDAVVIELLPAAQWRAPATRLAGQSANAEEDDALERAALAEAESRGAGGGGAAGGAGGAAAATPREILAGAAAAARSRTGAQPTARVVGVLRRAWRTMCGSLEPTVDDSKGARSDTGAPEFVLFSPWDARLPRVRIETRQKATLLDKRIVVSIDAWDTADAYPRGHYVRTIGTIGDKAAENEVIILEHEIIARPFSADVIACLPPASWTIPLDACAPGAKRRDLRHLDVCSIDPPGCKDIDDALHARPLTAAEAGGEEGVVEVGVHIADVSFFVRHDTAIDIEASERANTTYLVERRLDMLPGLLTETLCSLKGGVDRFAFSVTWQLRRVPSTDARCAPGGSLASVAPADRWEIIADRTQYFKSIIHSRAAMTYQAAQELLDDAVADSPVARAVKLLASIARCLRRQRIESGALSLASPEVKFLLDSETHDPTDVSAYVTRETNSTVEEFMLLANCAVAERVTAAFPRCSLLRRHPAPPRSAFDGLVAAARAVGCELHVDSGKALAESLDSANVPGRPAFQKLLRILTTRCMLQAAYFPSGQCPPAEYEHYGLAAPIYTHFTSPIRRYADVVVHRLLAAAIDVDPLPVKYQDKTYMTAIAANMNKRHLMSQMAGRSSGSLHTNIFFKSRVVVETGLVMKLRANGAVILVPRFALERLVVLSRPARPGAAASAPPQRTFVYNESEQILTDAGNPSLSLRIFDEVKVVLVVEERVRDRKELVVRIIEPAFESFDFRALPTSVIVDDRTVVVATDKRPIELATMTESQQRKKARST